MEVFVTSPFGSGRLDLFDAANSQYYEVKHAPLASSWNGSIQKLKYDNCTINGKMFAGYTFDGSPTPGSRIDILGRFQYKYWDVTYEAQGNGLIIYRANLNKKRYFEHMEVVINSAGVAGVGAALGYFYGKATRPGAGKYLYTDMKFE